MTSVDEMLTTRPQLVVNGRYRIGDQSFQRVTNFVKLTEDRHNLEKWLLRTAARGFALRSDLIATAASLTDDEKKKLDDVVEQAIEAAKASAKANIGSALHLFAERVDRGEDVHIPAPWDADIKVYTETLASNGVRVDPALMEGVVVHRGFQVAGRFDRIVTIDGHRLPYIADLKTGSIDFGLSSIAAQLHIYASADDLYDETTGLCGPMPEVNQDQALVIHLPAGEARCELLFVPLDHGRAVAELCAQVRDQRRNRCQAIPFTQAAGERAKWLADRVRFIADHHPDALGDLAGMWPAGVPTFKSGEPHTDDDLNSIALAVSAVEAKHQVTFGDPDPLNKRPDAAVIDDLAARLQALPEDLLDACNTIAAGADLPGVRNRRFQQRHVADVEAILEDAEKVALTRRLEADDLIGSITAGDGALRPAVVTACGSNGGSWTARQLDVLRAIRNAAETSALTWVDGVLCCPGGEGALIDMHGNKRDALAAVKQLAEAFSLPKPRSVSEAATNPTLVALAMVNEQRTSAA